jgi:hypothetical protein
MITGSMANQKGRKVDAGQLLLHIFYQPQTLVSGDVPLLPVGAADAWRISPSKKTPKTRANDIISLSKNGAQHHTHPHNTGIPPTHSFQMLIEK